MSIVLIFGEGGEFVLLQAQDRNNKTKRNTLVVLQGRATRQMVSFVHAPDDSLLFFTLNSEHTALLGQNTEYTYNAAQYRVQIE